MFTVQLKKLVEAHAYYTIYYRVACIVVIQKQSQPHKTHTHSISEKTAARAPSETRAMLRRYTKTHEEDEEETQHERVLARSSSRFITNF